MLTYTFLGFPAALWVVVDLVLMLAMIFAYRAASKRKWLPGLGIAFTAFNVAFNFFLAVIGFIR